MKGIFSYFLLTLLVSAYPLLQSGTNGKIKVRAAILASGADIEAARILQGNLTSLGFTNVSIWNASEFYVEFSMFKVDLLYVVGGPLASNGVGAISSTFLSSEAKANLSKPGSYGYWVVSKFHEAFVCVIIAGNTRVETKLAVEEYLKKGLDKTYLCVGVTAYNNLTTHQVIELKAYGLKPVLMVENRTLIGYASIRDIPSIAKLDYVMDVKSIQLVGVVYVKISNVITGGE